MSADEDEADMDDHELAGAVFQHLLAEAEPRLPSVVDQALHGGRRTVRRRRMATGVGILSLAAVIATSGFALAGHGRTEVTPGGTTSGTPSASPSTPASGPPQFVTPSPAPGTAAATATPTAPTISTPSTAPITTPTPSTTAQGTTPDPSPPLSFGYSRTATAY